MVPEALQEDLVSLGYRIKDFHIRRGIQASPVAKMVVTARKGDLDQNDRHTIREVVSFNLPGIEVQSSPTGLGTSQNIVISWRYSNG